MLPKKYQPTQQKRPANKTSSKLKTAVQLKVQPQLLKKALQQLTAQSVEIVCVSHQAAKPKRAARKIAKTANNSNQKMYYRYFAFTLTKFLTRSIVNNVL
ncbi:MAG: hypothetical protein UT11_C0005G0007 [Berkelbacteria bacterium GW2011_GWA2_38_9]|uniref:Uncharacterized protein n=1 Tax=Berkelbacteria bacterium GW2011_GWA2_38_9 TaxID=1618334 RepID=A0A0G0PMD3_9BACT|nr:MAG: hypothetical protein UT11_C0005G0007 [Berkelbacteria bacterium GW2011_GWA2_38_9]